MSGEFVPAEDDEEDAAGEGIALRFNDVLMSGTIVPAFQ